MAEREPISKKLRFEVFKRDSFTCQYCGKMAPDVVLEVDHIEPVKGGGKTNIMNLVTSCKDCNRGKGARPLTDNQVIKQQQEQLKEINERREQLKLMLKWKKELEKFEQEQVAVINDMIRAVSDKELSDYGKENIKKAIQKYGMGEVIESAKISIHRYAHDGISKAIDYIPRICVMRLKEKSDPWLPKKLYIRGIIKNRFSIYNDGRLQHMLGQLIDNQEDAEIIEMLAKRAKNRTEFWDEINETYEGDF